MSRQIISIALVLSAALFIAACGGATMSNPRSSSTAAMSSTDDAAITARVKTALLNDTQINATRIDVATSNGVVTMSGAVKSKAEEQRAIQLARQVNGVKDVKSTLQVAGG
jgi:osmotically-inducible protein OsmY